MQVASIALNPRQRNTHWPLFAYPVSSVFSSRTCDSFASAPLEGTVAFVRPENSSVSESVARTFLGIQIRDASQIRDICNSETGLMTLGRLLPAENGITVDDWYLLSERPLRHMESSFRTNMVPVDLDAGNGNTVGITENETSRAQQ